MTSAGTEEITMAEPTGIAALAQEAAARVRQNRPESPLADDLAQRQLRQVIDSQGEAAEVWLDQWTERLPLRYRRAEATHPDVIAWANDVVKGASNGLALVGGTGRGKTHQGYGALRLIAQGMRDDYRRPLLVDWSVPDLMDILRGFDSVPGKSTDAVLKECIAADVLFLDDIGLIADTDRVETLLYRIINARWRDMKPIFVTTDLEPDAFNEALGRRITSRLAGMVAYKTLTGPDLRRTA
jgi:DNA replication protein DnaC